MQGELNSLEDNVLAGAGFQRGELLPIAASRQDMDLFVIGRRASRSPGAVVWFAGYEIDRYPTFDEYFLAMMDDNRLEIQDLLAERGKHS